MKSHKTTNCDIEKIEFRLSESMPIILLHHKAVSKSSLGYFNMHFELELGIVIKGKMRRHIKDRQQDLKAGDVWLCGMWEPHGSQITSNNSESVVFIIYPPILLETQLDKVHPVRLLNPFENEPETRPQPTQKDKSKIMELALEAAELSSRKSKFTNARLRVKLYEILLILMETWKSPTQQTPQNANELAKINKAVKLVFTNPKGIATQQAADACSMNRNSFAKLFLQIMGIRFSEFNLRFRLTQAANALKTTEQPIKRIAFDCGFANDSHLHRLFRQFYNQTPQEFRNS